MRGILAAVTITGLALSTALIPGGVAASPTYAAKPGDRVAFAKALDGLVAAGAPGALGVTKDSSGTWRAGKGVSDLKTNAKTDPTTRWRIGSVTKSFVSVVTLQLVGEGKVALDKPIETYLPGKVKNGSNITVRMLLQHTSGIYDYAASLADTPEKMRQMLKTDYTPQQLVDIGNSKDPVFAPGASWGYSNTNYILLGLLIEKLTGMPVQQALASRVQAPLGLKSMTFPTGKESTISGKHLHGYMIDGTNPTDDVSTQKMSWGWAAGAYISNADDLNTFYAALQNGKLLKPALLKEMRTAKELSASVSYGLGLMHYKLSCGASVWGHSGGVPGYTTLTLTAETGEQMTVAASIIPLTGDQTTKMNAALTDAMTAQFCPGTKATATDRAAVQAAQASPFG